MGSSVLMGMKIRIETAIFLLLLTIATSGQSAIDSIDKRYAEIVEKARLCETNDDTGQFGELFLNTLTVNSRSHQWRAVGIYGQTIKFFHRTVENDEKRLYPDQLVFIKTERRVSSRTYNEEYLFSDVGALLFYFQRSEGDDETPGERRVYFSQTKSIRVIEDSNKRDRPNAKDLKTAAAILAASRRLSEAFRLGLKL